MIEILALSVLLAAGFGLAQLVKLIHLPSVTGFIIAGALLGPSGFDIVSIDFAEDRLAVFTNMALMLVAFGIGERFDLQQLRSLAKPIVRISAGEIIGCFVLVVAGSLGVCWMTGVGGDIAGWTVWLTVAFILGAIAIATAPATTVAVIRETGASGNATRLLLSSVVVNNALSVTLFGIVISTARVLFEPSAQLGIDSLILPVVKTGGALAIGLGTGFITDVLVNKFTRREDVLIVALAALFFCGGLADFLGLSSLLAGVAAGFAVVNRHRRDVRVFRALNDLEPPFYGIFFALAGLQLHLQELTYAGLMGVVFIIFRGLGKYFGARWGARSAGLPPEQADNIGMGLLPQAGLAIALAYVIRQEPSLEVVRGLLLNVVIASVVINEIIGPPLVRMMVVRAGEITVSVKERGGEAQASDISRSYVPESLPTLSPVPTPQKARGMVVFGVSNPATAPGVARIAVLISHHFKSLPRAVHVINPERSRKDAEEDPWVKELFRLAGSEAGQLGYPLRADFEFDEDAARGFLQAAESSDAQTIVLGHPLTKRAPEFERIVDFVARRSACPVVVAKFGRSLSSTRILVPVMSMDELAVLTPFCKAMAQVPGEKLTIFFLAPGETQEKELKEIRENILTRFTSEDFDRDLEVDVLATDSRLHSILGAAEGHDLIIMNAAGQGRLSRVFFGSLAEDVAQRVDETMLLIRAGTEVDLFAAWTEPI